VKHVAAASRAAAKLAASERQLVKRLRRIRALDDHEQQLVDLVEEAGTTEELLTRCEAQRAEVQALQVRIDECEARIGALRQQLAEIERRLVAEARVIGTTLAQLVLH